MVSKRNRIDWTDPSVVAGCDVPGHHFFLFWITSEHVQQADQCARTADLSARYQVRHGVQARTHQNKPSSCSWGSTTRSTIE